MLRRFAFGFAHRASAFAARSRVVPLAGRFEERLPEAAKLVDGPRLYLFLGSSLGNYDDAEIGAIFRLVRACMRDGGGSGDRFVVGVDTPHSPRKPARVIHAAYNDAAGATAAFTLNALAHVNRVAGVDFDWEGGWRHIAEYDEACQPAISGADGRRCGRIADFTSERVRGLSGARPHPLRAVRAAREAEERCRHRRDARSR